MGISNEDQWGAHLGRSSLRLYGAGSTGEHPLSVVYQLRYLTWRCAIKKQVIAFMLSYNLTAFLTKLSLLLLYLRIFKPNKTTRYAVYLGVVVNFLFYLSTFIVMASFCIPRPHQSFLETIFGQRCQRANDLSYPQGIFGVVSDFYIFFLPMPAVFQLNLPMRKKIGVALIFMTGFLYV